MHAIERLRYVARSGEVDATELACEATYALSGLASDRRALVLACRRLLEFHPRCGPLWWVSAHTIDSVDPRASAASLISRLEDDDSIDELFALPESHDVVATHLTRPIMRALAGRPDLAVQLVGSPRELRSGMRYFADSAAGVQGYLEDDIDRALERSSLVVVEARAAGAAGYLFDGPARALASRAGDLGIPLYVLAGVGRILADEIFSAMIAHLHWLESSGSNDDDDEGADTVRAGLVGTLCEEARDDRAQHRDLVEVQAALGVVTERGLRTPRVVFHPSPSVSHLDCPAPAELLSLVMTSPSMTSPTMTSSSMSPTSRNPRTRR